MLAALLLALPILEEDRRNLVESNSLLKSNEAGELVPVPGTLDPDCAEWVAAYDAAIKATCIAITKTEGRS